MLSPQQAILESWSFPPWVTALDLFAALLYARGWLTLHRAIPRWFPAWRLLCFLGGIASLQIALASPIDAFDPFLLSVHMTQHMILMMVVAPLLLLGNPMIPLLRGLPRWIARKLLRPALKWPPLTLLARKITHPAFCWVVFSVCLFAWHFPGPYGLALRSDRWHDVEHATFLLTSVLFWWPVVQPWPSRPHWPRWTVPLYLLLADFVNSVISAFLIFSGRVLYPSYSHIPRIASVSAEGDQVLAGVIMWFVGSFVFLVPAVVLTAKLLSPRHGEPAVPRGARAPESRFRHVAVSSLVIALPLAVLACGCLAPSAIDIDGDIIRVQTLSGPFHISVFTPPDPLAAGPCDVAVLVQGQSGEPILDVPVSLSVQQPDSVNDPPMVIAASAHDASLKLLKAGTINLGRKGVWNLKILIGRGSSAETVQSELNVESPE